MNKLKYSAYSLIVFSIIKLGLIIPIRELVEEVKEMQTRYSQMQIDAEWVSKFEDSLIYNSDFRTRILGTRFKKEQFDSAILANRARAVKDIQKTEILYNDRIELGKRFKVLSVIDNLTELLFALSAGLMIYYWIKLRK